MTKADDLPAQHDPVCIPILTCIFNSGKCLGLNCSKALKIFKDRFAISPESKKGGKDQGTIQSSTTPDQGHRMGK